MTSAKTKAFARFLGPYFMVMPAIIITRMPEMETILRAFFANPALVFIMGAALFGLGLVVITQHPVWHGFTAILISVMGWVLAFRGLAILIMPDVFFAVAQSLIPQAMIVQAMFGVIFLIGLWLSYEGWRIGTAPE